MRAVTLGHGYEPVVEAVRAAIGGGVSFSRPTAMELDAAEDFVATVVGAEMVKFTKNASDATAAAVRLARAATGRDHVAACAQPFFSGQDWFVGTLPLDAGVPAAVRGSPTASPTTTSTRCARCWPSADRLRDHGARHSPPSPPPATSKACASSATSTAPCSSSTR